jgi:hypothetical protein
MEQTGVLENTLIMLIGDHGEAFGERHPGNFTHKNFLYEENVRSFLILLWPGALHGPIVSERVASMGDVFPTLLRALGAELAEVPGQSLWPPDYAARPVFFHKNAHPELWGLRDGQWKFVARRVGEKQFELYDLEQDPQEQDNRADLYPKRVELYDRLCAKWFTVANDSFVAGLEGYSKLTGSPFSVSELGPAGPKRLVVGTRDDAGRVVRAPGLRPGDLPVASTLWVAHPEDRSVLYAWTSPSGETWSSAFSLNANWTRTRVDFPGPLPLAEGRWRVTLWDHDRPLISDHFDVIREAARTPD